MSNQPDWVWAVTPDNEGSTHGTYHGFDESSPFLYQLPPEPGPGTFYLDDAVLPVTSKVARLGIKGVQQQVVTGTGAIKAIVHVRRGPLGWITQRWLRNHPLQITAQMYRPEWGEWRIQVGKVEVL